MNKPKWYCLLLDSQRLRGISDIQKYLQRELVDIFGNDFLEVCLIGEQVDEEVFELYTESYAFINCINYHSHLSRLKSSALIQLVLPSFDEPDIVPEESIIQFDETARYKYGSARVFEVGDVVFVRNGYLQNLYGIVVDQCDDGDYSVFFKLCTRYFIEKFRGINLTAKGSLFQHIKFPVKMSDTGVDMSTISPVAKKVVEGCLIENKICGDVCGTHQSKKKREAAGSL